MAAAGFEVTSPCRLSGLPKVKRESFIALLLHAVNGVSHNNTICQ